jgi:hypothetical protein
MVQIDHLDMRTTEQFRLRIRAFGSFFLSFGQLFEKFRVNPCEFYHIKNRLLTSNSRGLKGIAGTTNNFGSLRVPDLW